MRCSTGTCRGGPWNGRSSVFTHLCSASTRASSIHRTPDSAASRQDLQVAQREGVNATKILDAHRHMARNVIDVSDGALRAIPGCSKPAMGRDQLFVVVPGR